MKLNKTREMLVTEILKVLECDEIPFTSKWISPLKNYNIISNKNYKGVNQFLLSMIGSIRNLEDPRWVTFKQAKDNKWVVKKGAKGIPIEFWSFYNIKEKKKISIGEMQKQIELNKDCKDNFKPISDVYYVFNAKDVDGIPPLQKEVVKNFDVSHTLAMHVLETYLEHEKIPLIHKGYEAYYTILKDQITLPKKENFKSEYDYISTLAHEICHSTGHGKRLNREAKKFRTPQYALEELRAEISSSFLCSDLQIESSQSDIQNHKAYIQSWIQIITDTPAELFKAINDSQGISDYVLEKGDFEKNKQQVEELEIEKLVDNFNWLDVNEQIEVFYSVQQKSSLFNDVEFVDENECFYEEGEKAEKVIEYVANNGNQKKLAKWLFDNDTSHEKLLEQSDLNLEEDLGVSLEMEK